MEKSRLIQNFSEPESQDRGKPFWAWNGELREEELLRQVQIMKEMGYGGFFMHSRSGLITEYLGEEWFQCINAVADAAEKVGLEAWLYDEDRWPSGSAGGKVTVDPQYRAKSLYLYEIPADKYHGEDAMFLYIAKVKDVSVYSYRRVLSGECWENVLTACQEADAALPGEWKVLRFVVEERACESNYNGTTYIDTMNAAATKRFIELTHEAYKKHCGERLGRSIRGIFTDEPHRGNMLDNYRKTDDGTVSCAVCYTEDILEEFKSRYEYDPLELLPELFYRPRGERVSKIKLHYIDLANNLFIERFLVPVRDWCAENGLLLTGHLLHEDSLMNQTVPCGSLMRCYAYMDYPGIDNLGRSNECYWAAKQLSSVAAQLGQKHLLSESYAGTGWDFSLRGHRQIGNWQALFGVNLRCPHLSWYTMEGAAKRDYPASFLHQSPWWRDYAAVETYFARFGIINSAGTPARDLLVLNPIESVWCQMYLGCANWVWNISPDIGEYEERYRQLFYYLEDNHIDFDYGEEEMIARLASVERGADGKPVFRVGKAVYHKILVGNMLTVRRTTLALLEKFRKMGGEVVFAGEPPHYVDAVPSEEAAELAKQCIMTTYDENGILSAFAADNCICIKDADGKNESRVYAVKRNRIYGDDSAVILINRDDGTALKNITVSVLTDGAKHLQKWDMESGERFDADGIVTHSGDCISFNIDLEPSEGCCFIIASEYEALPKLTKTVEISSLTVSGMFDYEMAEENVCVLDYARWRSYGNESWSEKAEVLRIDSSIRDHFGIERRSGEMLQPWYVQLNKHESYGKICLEYVFEVENLPLGPIFLAAERPEINTYCINGTRLYNYDRNDFYIDECFQKMLIPVGTLKQGKNIVTVEFELTYTSNVEALYIIGDFGVKVDGNVPCICELPNKIGTQNYSCYHMPFYTGDMTYLIPTSDIASKMNIDEGERITISAPDFKGPAIRIAASGETKSIVWEPFEADVTDAVISGETVKLTVVGMRRNLFGPLHILPKERGWCSPAEYCTSGEAWTDDYALVDCGLRSVVFKKQKRYEA